jgi:hypothetical protein
MKKTSEPNNLPTQLPHPPLHAEEENRRGKVVKGREGR